MNYRKSTYKKIISFLLTLAGVVLISLLLLGGIEFKRSETRMQEEITMLFKEAIHEEVELKMEGVYQYTSFTRNPAPKKDSIMNRTIITNDTIITKKSVISDNRILELIKDSQSYLMLVNRLWPDTLQQLFNTKIEEKNIKAHPYVLVHHGNDTLMSANTTGRRLNYRVPVVKGGVFDEISYEAFLSYPPSVVFNMMSKTALVFLFVLELLILSFVFYLYRRLKQVQPDKIVKRGKCYYIGETILNPLTGELLSNQGKQKLPGQMFGILMMLVENENNLVSKEVIIERYWSKNTRSEENMVSTISKLRNVLNSVGCSFNITKIKGSDYYKLEYVDT